MIRAFGWHSASKTEEHLYDIAYAESTVSLGNVAKIASLIPVINIVTGIIMLACDPDPKSPKNGIVITRWVLTILTGPLMVIGDLIATIAMRSIYKKDPMRWERIMRRDFFNYSHLNSHHIGQETIPLGRIKMPT